jgi:hypothetical protein
VYIAGTGRAVLAVVALAYLFSPGGVALGAPVGATSTTVLPCRDQIDSSTAPAPELTTFGPVALPIRFALGAVLLPNEPDPNARYWAKTGLDIKAGASFELVVPPEWRGRLSVGWGNGAPRTTRLQVAACRWMPSPSQSSPARAWLGFAGGYWVRNPACVSLLVRTAHRTRRVHIGVGAACPGQSPPLVHLPSSAS